LTLALCTPILQPIAMDASSASVQVLVEGGVVVLRIVGKANCIGSCKFKVAVEQFVAKGFGEFILELSDCTLMDSTFLGVLAGFVLEDGQASGKRHFKLLNANERVHELIENLGVDTLFDLREESLASESPDQAVTSVDELPARKSEICRTSLQAHEVLMRFNHQNRERFKDVARFLAEDLHRLEASGQ